MSCSGGVHDKKKCALMCQPKKGDTACFTGSIVCQASGGQ